MVKNAKICKKTRFFIKNVCFDTRFGQLSGIQQFILSQLIDIHHFKLLRLNSLYNELYGNKGRKIPKNTFFHKKCVLGDQI